ncbi:uncharacterized protein LOC113342846 [Papaver somniferum]|uniref:uncharacterized protein LOC113342846 n=1 Tax=Papaver somniferum TaxID=3469 RepID=UPI000E6F6CF1|nr:uncharacterized protein LOC113342846 [Papaver somniferum]
MVLLLYVDDIILTGYSASLIDRLVTYFSVAFAMKYLVDLHFFLDIEAIRNVDGILLTQKKYALELMDKAKMLECNPCSTPVAKGQRVSISYGVLLTNPSEYRTIVGTLQYLCMKRPDICFGVNYVSQYMHSPIDVHMLLVKRILRYLKGSISIGITMRKGDIDSLTAYTDSDWGNCPETVRSTCGFAIFLGSSLVSWSSKKQPAIYGSTAEAEYECLLVATADLEWLSSVLSELHISLVQPITLYCHNTSAIYLTTIHVSHSRAKYIKIHYHVVRQLVASGFLSVQHIASENQLADLFTKGLCAPVFSSLLHQLSGTSLSSSNEDSSTTTATSSGVEDFTVATTVYCLSDVPYHVRHASV